MIQPAPSHDGFSFNEFNQEVQSFQLTIEIIDQGSVIARKVEIAHDSTSFLDVRTDVSMKVSTGRIKTIILEDHASGRSRGLLLGTVVGGIGGIGIAIASGISMSTYPWSPATIGGIVGGGVLIGRLVGGAIGSAAGVTHTFVVAHDSLQTK
jgi:hypothetical protein